MLSIPEGLTYSSISPCLAIPSFVFVEVFQPPFLSEPTRSTRAGVHFEVQKCISGFPVSFISCELGFCVCLCVCVVR
jgi:hypothetical protein